MTTLPTLFVSHGAPTLALETDAPMNRFLREFGAETAPRAIVVASAHWDRRDFSVSAAAKPETIYDFGGFDPALYEITYGAPGAPQLAAQIVELAVKAGVDVTTDSGRGFDHGVWVPLLALRETADIPVVSLSVSSTRSAAEHLALGRALAPLREQGVLILGSGSATHNLGGVFRPDLRARLIAPTKAFNGWLNDAVTKGDEAALVDYVRTAPEAHLSHPTPEHFLPFFVPFGAAGGRPGTIASEGFDFDILAMSAFVWR